MRTRLVCLLGTAVAVICGGACQDPVGLTPDELGGQGPPLQSEIVVRLPDANGEHRFELVDPTYTGGPEPVYVARVPVGMTYREVGDRLFPISVDEIEPGDQVELWTLPEAGRGGGPGLTYLIDRTR